MKHFISILKSRVAIYLVQFLLLSTGNLCGQSHYINTCTVAGLRELFQYDGNSLPFVSAHRGGATDSLPENSIVAFEQTLRHTYSIMEIDPRYTKDSVMVILHDPTLQRTTTGNGKVIDYSYKELLKFKLKDKAGNVTAYSIPSFEEVLIWGKGKTIFVLDNKGVSIEARVKTVKKNMAEAYCIVMAYNFEEAKACYQLDNEIMMQVFIPNMVKFAEFDKTGIPWSNVVVFVGHQLPDDLSVIKSIHEKGARCILGTSRNLDKMYTDGKVSGIGDLKSNYVDLFWKGIDILETDIPVPLSSILDWENTFNPSLQSFFIKK